MFRSPLGKLIINFQSFENFNLRISFAAFMFDKFLCLSELVNFLCWINSHIDPYNFLNDDLLRLY